jgi:hypothetical protein
MLAGLAGCTPNTRFPQALRAEKVGNEQVLSYDVDADNRPDYWEYRAPAGRTTALAWADRQGHAGQRVELDAVEPGTCPHLVIILDGVPFDLVQRLYVEGHFRLFHPPSRVVSCYPAMTDLALAEMFHVSPCTAFQARRFDPATNRILDGNDAYLRGEAAPWAQYVDYRCSYWWDALVYLNPQVVFDHELAGMRRLFRDVRTGEAYAYSVGTAGLGTRGGRDAIEAYLLEIEQLCQRIVYERRGQVQITLTADHGHNLVPHRRIKLDDVLETGGYRSADSLRDPRDVVALKYGLVTYAGLFTRDPAGVAQCVARHEDVTFASYRDDDAVVVIGPAGRGVIRQAAGGYTYTAEGDDPLFLQAVVALLRKDGKVSGEGVVDDRALLRATADHVYPDPLHRLWRAFHGLAKEPPDVIVNLRDGACHGSRFFKTMVGKVASTHGGLNRQNSLTFVMSMRGELPGVLRSEDVLEALQEAVRGGTRTGALER